MAKRTSPPKEPENSDSLALLLEVAPPKVVAELILQLAASRPAVHRECLDYLVRRVMPEPERKERIAGEAVLALWEELLPDLEELDELGGGDDDQILFVADLVDDIVQRLGTGAVSAEYRDVLREEVLPLVKSGNSGLEDELRALAAATCREAEEWRDLARAYERMGERSRSSDARKIYRSLGDREKYLELRLSNMCYGADFHDLATFYWESGERDRALEVAEEGLKKGKGMLSDLRRFLAGYAIETGDRARAIELQFQETLNGLDLKSYKSFRTRCTSEEWAAFEPRLLASLDKVTHRADRILIHMHRGERDKALAILVGKGSQSAFLAQEEVIEVARQLETPYPEEILAYYLSGLKQVGVSGTRQDYVRRAGLMVKVRHVMLEVLKDPARWHDYALGVKRLNVTRPACQEEFARIIPGWKSLR